MSKMVHFPSTTFLNMTKIQHQRYDQRWLQLELELSLKFRKYSCLWRYSFSTLYALNILQFLAKVDPLKHPTATKLKVFRTMKMSSFMILSKYPILAEKKFLRCRTVNRKGKRKCCHVFLATIYVSHVSPVVNYSNLQVT